MTTMTPTTAAEAVANGAQRLDKIKPDWYREINLGILDVASGYDCICGQLGDEIWEQMGNTGPAGFAESLGIVCSKGIGYGELTVEWRAAIIARRDADKLDRAKVKTRKENALA